MKTIDLDFGVNGNLQKNVGIEGLDSGLVQARSESELDKIISFRFFISCSKKGRVHC